MGEPLVTISLPMWRAAATIRRAVDGILGQTVHDLHLCVVNDGGGPEAWEPLNDIDDPRLERIDVPINLGRYHADHLVLHQHCHSKWLAIHDADDWAESHWLRSLLNCVDGDTDCVLADHLVHPANAPARLSKAQKWDGTKRFTWHAHMAGLWRADWLRDRNLTNPHVRVAWDAYMTGAAQVVGTTAICRAPLYHRVRTPESLTTSRSTGIRSDYRRRVTPRIKAAWENLVKDPTSAPSIPDGFRQRRSSSDLIANQRLFTDGWPLDRSSAAELDALLWERKPSVVLECGSGHSTLVCARYARDHGATVISLEHQQRYADGTRQQLRRDGLLSYVDLRLAPLKNTPAGPWYDTPLPDGIDFVLVDGPPAAQGGRAAAFPEIQPHLAKNWAILLDDANRDSERAALHAWSETGLAHWTARGSSALVTATPHQPTIDASDVFLTVLTGSRPNLLSATLSSLPRSLLESAKTMALHTGAETDPDTSAILTMWGWAFDRVDGHPEVRSIGDNITDLAAAAFASGKPFWLHLEDDWAYDTHTEQWLAEAQSIITSGHAKQVRLRRCGEKVSPRSMVSNRTIRWEPGDGFQFGQAHFTFNPFLMRSVDAPRVFPATGEKDAQRNAHANGIHVVAQHHPGVWRHIGGKESLRAQTGCEP